MTIEEKVGQLCQHDGRKDAERHARGAAPRLVPVRPRRGCPRACRSWPRSTRLGIPLLFGMDAIHGHALWPGATVLPSQLAMSSAWDPEMVEEAGRITAREAAATGAHWTFSPVCDIARDTRWGRVDETFGEDPYLAGELIAAIVRGYQGEDPRDPDRVMACAKHYAGYCETQGGRDASEADLSHRKLLSYLLPPYRAAVRAGCATMMTAYQAIDGVPCTLSRWLLTEVLREQWGFARVRRHRLGQRGPAALEHAHLPDAGGGRCGRRAGGQRHDDVHPRLLRGGAERRARGRPARGAGRAGRAPHPAHQVRARALRRAPLPGPEEGAHRPRAAPSTAPSRWSAPADRSCC